MNKGGLTRRAAFRLVSGVLPATFWSAARAHNAGTLRTVTVTSGSELETALASAQPGDSIEMTTTGLTGEFIANASGTESRPIFITSRSGWDGGVSSALTVNGSHVAIWKMRTAQLHIHGDHCRVSRNYITAPTTVYVGAFNCIFEYNDVTGTGPGLNIRPSTSAARPYGAWVHHNYCHDRAGSSNTDRQAICYANGSQEGAFADHSGLVEYNLVEDWDASWAFASKTTGIVWRFNTCRNCNRGMESRVGDHNDWIANTSINSNLNKIHGTGHRLIGNYVNRVSPSNTRGWVLMAGSVDGRAGYLAASPNYPQWQNAKGCLVSGCEGALTIGGRTSSDWNIYADGNTVENHVGNVAIGAYQMNTTDNRIGPSSVQVPAHVTLTSADVGPFAHL